MNDRGLLLFALESSRAFGERVAARLGRALASHEEREFGGGEHKARPLDEVAGRDVYVINGLDGEAGNSANDKLVRLLFFIGALKDAGAASVTAVAPYLAYSRKDRRTKPRDPVSSRYVAALFESVGTDRLVTVEAHNVSAFENSFRACRPEHIPTARLLAENLAAGLGDRPVAVISPDAGGSKRAELFRSELERRLGRPVGNGMMEKYRSAGIVSGSLFAGDVAGRTAIIIDDLVVSGTTILRAAQACRDAGAAEVIAAVAHGMFSSDSALFREDGPDQVVVTDTVPVPGDLPDFARARLSIVSAAELVGDVVGRLHSGEPVSDLIPYD